MSEVARQIGMAGEYLILLPISELDALLNL